MPRIKNPDEKSQMQVLKKVNGPTIELNRKILALKANPAIRTHREIAEILGINEQTVYRHVNSFKEELAEANSRLQEYQGVLLGDFTIANRARRYIELAKQDESPHVALQTLIRIDDIDGIVTEKDRLRAINQPSGHEFNTPMFMLTPGSSVSVRMSKDQHGESTAEVTVSEAQNQQVEQTAEDNPEKHEDPNV